jgi:hypothetical protein
MDQLAFDGLCERVATGVDRRGALGILAAAAVGMGQTSGGGSAATCKFSLAPCASNEFCLQRNSDLCVGGHCVKNLDRRIGPLSCDDGCWSDETCSGGFCRAGCDPSDPRFCNGECVPAGDAGYCLECTEDAHCSRFPSHQHCVDNFCAGCATDAHCGVAGAGSSDWLRPGTPMVCRGASCHPGCAGDADCATAYTVNGDAKPVAYSCVNGACAWNLHKAWCIYGSPTGGSA